MNLSISKIIDFAPNTAQHNTLKYSFEQYQNITKEHMHKFLSNKILENNSLTMVNILELIRDQDVFSNLVTAVMMADWSYDPSKSSKKYWRTKCILFTLGKMFRNYEHEKNTTTCTKYLTYNKLPDTDSLFEERITLVDKSINQLDSRKQQIIKLKYFNNKTDKDIAKTLKLTQQRVNTLLSDSKYELATKLNGLV